MDNLHILSWMPNVAKRKLILGSASPRRREILQEMGLDFQVVTTLQDDAEDHTHFEKKEEYVRHTAFMKAKEIVQRCKDDASIPDNFLVIAADTVVVLDNKVVLEKPKDAEDSRRMLRELSGRKHTVMTCTVTARCVDPARHPNSVGVEKFTGHDIELMCQDGVRLSYHVAKTDVYFGSVDKHLLEAYVTSGEPFGKAGGYGIQGNASLFIDKIDGDYWNVVGLSKRSVYALLEFEEGSLRDSP
ncbi:inosine triphosphate pyrophosphatase-like protein [Fennellomyces sp. T-0311]|nr:inosine triphosphate pyrophosphatase-like protein [Fennellomyces sp. T-0311]